MKRVLFISLAIIIMFSSASFAAKLGVSGDGGRFGVGMFGMVPTIRYNFTDSFSGQLGVNLLNSSAAGSNAQLQFLGVGQFDLYKAGANTVNMGFLVNYLTNFATIPSASIMTLGLTWGVETKLNQSLVVGIVVVPISYTTTNGLLANNPSQLGILSMPSGLFTPGAGATITAHYYL